jgi:Na+-driven multidrug efflux pump
MSSRSDLPFPSEAGAWPCREAEIHTLDGTPLRRPAADVYPAVMSTPITLPRLARFWMPLQATWLMMAIEGPFLAAVIARLAEPKLNLAAYGVAFSFAIIVEAPVIMMMSASTALVSARPGYLALRRFAHALNALITAAMVLSLATPVMSFLLLDLMRLNADVAQLTHRALWILLPWPAAIGYRRFYQGILIRAGLTRRVAWGTVVRLTTMTLSAVAAAAAGLPGTLVGAVALSAGVCMEALVSRLMAIQPVQDLPTTAPTGGRRVDLSWRGISAFYWPLALTSTISLAVHPLVTFFMGRAEAPLSSLAVLPVVNALIFVFRTPALSYQDVAIATLGQGTHQVRPVLRFAALLAMGSTLLLAVVAWTPLSRVWFETVSGLSPDLAAYAVWPVRILTLMPALSVLLNLERALLVHGRRTGPVTTASMLEVAGISLSLLVGVVWLDLVGVTVAAAAYMIGRVAANLYLAAPARRALNVGVPRA